MGAAQPDHLPSRPNPACGGQCPLPGLGLCDLIGDQDRSLLHKQAVKLTFHKGAIIAHHGAPQSSLLWLQGGAVRLSKSFNDEHRQILAFGFPGDLLSHGDGKLDWPGDLVAVSDCTLYMIEPDILAELRQRNPQIDSLLLHKSAEQVDRAYRHISLLEKASAVQRVARFLLELEPHLASGSQAGGPLRIPLQRAEIADYLGLKIETVSRTLRRLVMQGVIEMPKPTIIHFKARARLAALAGRT